MSGSILMWEDAEDVHWRSVANDGAISSTTPPSGGGIPQWDGDTDAVRWTPTEANVYELLVDGGAVVNAGGDGTTLQVIDSAGSIQHSVANLPRPDNGTWNYWSPGRYTATVGGAPMMIEGPEVMMSISTSDTINSGLLRRIRGSVTNDSEGFGCSSFFLTGAG